MSSVRPPHLAVASPIGIDVSATATANAEVSRPICASLRW